MPIPDSPPDLSSSKSSKSSSSFRSSILSDSAGLESVTHYEDISLDDLKRDSYDLNTHSVKDVQQGAQITPRPRLSIMGARKKPVPAVDTMRSVHTVQRRQSPHTRAVGVLDEKSTNLPLGRSPRAGYRTGSGSYGPSSPTSRFGDSRSPSPSKSLIMNNRLTRSSSSAPTGFLGAGPIRSKTWTPGQRKTVQQLEDEYHDSDEDVPDDAVIWNVPISPLGPFAAMSRDPSPRRKSSQSSLSSNGKSLALDRHQSAPSHTAPECSSETSRHMLTLPRSATTGSFPDQLGDAYSLRERHQSWTNDLCDDARLISAALGARASRASADTKRSATSLGSSSTPLPRSTASLPSLPPIQKSNIMIDPFPISKEKEAVLTRTRPSWLPPKCKKEERRHMKQWEQMMAHSAVADRRRAARRLEEIETARHVQHSTQSVWEEQILTNWDEAINEPRTRELWWRGISSKSRAQVWKKAIGNELQLNSASYAAALKRSASATESSVTSQIEADSASAFPETGLFKDDAPLKSSLMDVLKAHAAYRPDVGYVSGMHRIAALLLLNMPVNDAFICFANILNRPLPLAFLTDDKAAIDKWVGLVMSTIKVKLPALHDHLVSDKMASASNASEEKAIEDTVQSPAVDSVAGSRPSSRSGSTGSPKINPTEFVAPMLSTLFAAHLDVETLSRIWDIYVFESDKLLVRALAGLCSRVESKLYGTKAEVLAILGHKGTDNDVWRHLGDVDGVILDIREAGKANNHFDGSPRKTK